MANVVSCRLEERYITKLKQISDRADRSVSRTVRRILINALTSRTPPRNRRTRPTRAQTS